MPENLWLSFAFLTASIYATLALFDKIILDNFPYHPITNSALVGVPMMIGFIAIGVFTDSMHVVSTDIFGEMGLAIGVAIFAGFAYVASLWTYFAGLEKTDVSRFVPMFSLDLIIVLVLAFILFGERVHPVAYVAVLVIFIGTMLIAFEDLSVGATLHSPHALFWGFLVALSIAVFNVGLDFLTRSMTLTEIVAWVGIGGLVSLVLLLGWRSFSVGFDRPVERLLSVARISSIVIILRGIFPAIALFTFIRALEMGPVTLAVAILKLDVFLVFFGVLVLSYVAPEVLYERTKRSILVQKFAASILIVGGVVVIQVLIT